MGVAIGITGGQGRGLGSHLNGDAGRVNKKVLRWQKMCLPPLYSATKEAL